MEQLADFVSTCLIRLPTSRTTPLGLIPKQCERPKRAFRQPNLTYAPVVPEVYKIYKGSLCTTSASCEYYLGGQQHTRLLKAYTLVHLVLLSGLAPSLQASHVLPLTVLFYEEYGP